MASTALLMSISAVLLFIVLLFIVLLFIALMFIALALMLTQSAFHFFSRPDISTSIFLGQKYPPKPKGQEKLAENI